MSKTTLSRIPLIGAVLLAVTAGVLYYLEFVTFALVAGGVAFILLAVSLVMGGKGQDTSAAAAAGLGADPIPAGQFDPIALGIDPSDKDAVKAAKKTVPRGRKIP